VKSKIKVTDLDVEKVCRSQENRPAREVYYIFTKDEGKAKKALEILKAGVPFEKVAEEYSEDRATAKRGGYLGMVTKGSLIKPLDMAVWSTEPGKFRLVQAKNGYYIIYVKAEKSGKCNRDKIRQRLYMEKFQKALKSYIDELKQKASVKVYL
jgi:parvulin-like peptidyl-prolyl isomerase